MKHIPDFHPRAAARPIKRVGLQYFAMQNMDDAKAARMGILQSMASAIKDDDKEAFSQAFLDLADNIEQGIRKDFQEQMGQQDADILNARGCRVLTSEERQYYTDVLSAMRSDNPRQALTNVKTTLPPTVVDDIFENLSAEHPLLAEIDLQNTGALVKILLSTSGGVAAWGDLDAEVTSELTASFVQLDLTLASLTAFIPVNRSMVDMGPEWLDRYVRTILTEALATQLEVGIVSGDGKDAPIGMDKKLTGDSGGVYQKKTAVALNAINAETMAPILATLADGPNGKPRSFEEVLLVVNPMDYYTKIFPATTVRAADGTFANNVCPYPTKVIPSVGCTKGEAILGLGKKYFMGVGTAGGGGRIEFSDEYEFLKRIRTYLICLYGYGRALDENAFVLLDISNMTAAATEVVVKNIEKGTVTTTAAASEAAAASDQA